MQEFQTLAERTAPHLALSKSPFPTARQATRARYANATPTVAIGFHRLLWGHLWGHLPSRGAPRPEIGRASTRHLRQCRSASGVLNPSGTAIPA
jgi:hypothetical protein